MTKPTAAVLGAGPTGTIAARELADRGYDVTIITDRKPDLPTGAFYYHDLPESVRKVLSPTVIHHRYMGSHFSYEVKQWGTLYESSFNQKKVLERFMGWWPSEEIYARLTDGIRFQYLAVHAKYHFQAIAEANDFVVITFPLIHFPFRHFTPIARVRIKDVIELFSDEEFILFPGELYYDGEEHGYHNEIVRIATPIRDYGEGFCFVEMTKTSSLPVTHWMKGTYWVHDLHPFTPSLLLTHVALGTLPENVLLAGRFALGDVRYVSSDVIEDIKDRLGEL